MDNINDNKQRKEMPVSLPCSSFVLFVFQVDEEPKPSKCSACEQSQTLGQQEHEYRDF